MAKGKKSFLLYCDIIHTIEKLNNEQAGILFKHILNYVNDNDPKINDLLLEVVFEPIKQALKRDLKRYENICERNKINGLKGGRPSNPTEPKKPNGLIGNPKKPKKADIDIDIDIDIEKDINIPTFNEFIEIAKIKLSEAGLEYCKYEFSLKEKYQSWVDNKWRDGNNKPIKNLKSKIGNVIPFLKPIYTNSTEPIRNNKL